MKIIKEGMYVRTNNGYIGKVVEIVYINEEKRYSLDSTDIYLFADEDIIGEPSYDINDLIEVDDYINGSKVIRIGCKLLGPIIDGVEMDIYNGIETEHEFIKYVEDIKSVLTKEQFKRAAYEVKHESTN